MTKSSLFFKSYGIRVQTPLSDTAEIQVRENSNSEASPGTSKKLDHHQNCKFPDFLSTRDVV